MVTWNFTLDGEILTQGCSLCFIFFKDQGGHQSSGKPSKGQGRFKGGASARKNQLSFMNVSSETLWSDIQEFAKLKYQVSVFIKSLQGHWIFLKDWRSHFLQKVFKIKIFFLGCILVNLLGYIKKNLIRLLLLLLLFFPCLVKKLVQLGDLLRWFFFSIEHHLTSRGHILKWDHILDLSFSFLCCRK